MKHILIFIIAINTTAFSQSRFNIDISTDYKRWKLDYLTTDPKPPIDLYWATDIYNCLGFDAGVSWVSSIMKIDFSIYWNVSLKKERDIKGIESQASLNALYLFNATRDSDFYLGPSILYRRMIFFYSAKINSLGVGIDFSYGNWFSNIDYSVFIEPYPDIAVCNYQCDMTMFRLSFGYSFPILKKVRKAD